jgi:purine-nucleoside/S-methyl-5'-thioadenosine phosphorylase / adenosine deaminase
MVFPPQGPDSRLLNPRIAENGVQWFSNSGYEGLPWLWHGFSTRIGGVSSAYSSDVSATELNLGFTVADDEENVRENRRRLVEAITGSHETPLITVRQIHSNRTELADPGKVCDGDGLMTNQAGMLLGIMTADCIPVLIADPVRGAVAAFHAGWRGTVQRIVELGIARMQSEYSSIPSDLIAAIGPGIGPCCYQVGEQLLAEFQAHFTYANELFSPAPKEQADTTGPSPLHLDLIEANRRQLLEAGVPASSISVVGGCTSCHPNLFYSHRASNGHAGRMMSVIGIR